MNIPSDEPDVQNPGTSDTTVSQGGGSDPGPTGNGNGPPTSMPSTDGSNPGNEPENSSQEDKGKITFHFHWLLTC